MVIEKGVFEDHLHGELYVVTNPSDDDIDSYTKRCGQCGDSDWYLGTYSNWEDLKKEVNKDYDRYDDEYLKEVMNEK